MTTEDKSPNSRSWNDLFKTLYEGNILNKFIDEFNKYSKEDGKLDRLRRETTKKRVHFYGIVENGIKIKRDEENENKLSLVKIGKTDVSTEQDTKNRMEVIKAKLIAGDVLFVFTKRYIDTSTDLEVEKRIREQFGIGLHKDLAKRLDLPVPTEWVLTSHEYIEEFKKRKKTFTTKRCELTSEIFKDAELKKCLRDIKSQLTGLGLIVDGEKIRININEPPEWLEKLKDKGKVVQEKKAEDTDVKSDKHENEEADLHRSSSNKQEASPTMTGQNSHVKSIQQQEEDDKHDRSKVKQGRTGTKKQDASSVAKENSNASSPHQKKDETQGATDVRSSPTGLSQKKPTSKTSKKKIANGEMSHKAKYTKEKK